MTTRARDFKFAGTPAQRLQLAIVALTQKSFSAQYAWFSRGGSHMLKPHYKSQEGANIQQGGGANAPPRPPPLNAVLRMYSRLWLSINN